MQATMSRAPRYITPVDGNPFLFILLLNRWNRCLKGVSDCRKSSLTTRVTDRRIERSLRWISPETDRHVSFGHLHLAEVPGYSATEHGHSSPRRRSDTNDSCARESPPT